MRDSSESLEMEFQMIETRKIGLNREIEALKNIEHFGFLTTKCIADLTIGAEGDSALKSAKRVVKRLLKKKEILKRESLDGICCFVITKIGAKRVAPFCFEKKARSGVEVATRFAKRQELIVSTLRKLQEGIQNKSIVLGQVWLKRDKKKRFSGFHGLLWNFETKKGIPIFVASSCHVATAEHIVKLHYQHKEFLTKIIIVAIDSSTQAILKKRTIHIWNEFEKQLKKNEAIYL